MVKANVHCTFPSQMEIDDGYVFGKSFKFELSIRMIRPPALETTNQRILNEENAWKIYIELCSGEINDSAWLALRPIMFTPSFGLHDNKGSNVSFKEGESKASFLGTLSTMPRESMEEKQTSMLSNILWELVDGQHILHACNVLAVAELEAGQLSQEEYDSIFAKRPATIVVYDDEACYAAQSLKLNDFHTDHIHHTTLIERLTKARKVWQSFNCLFKDNDPIDNQLGFLRCLPSILKETPTKHRSIVKTTKNFYKNYLHLVMLNDRPWKLFKKMCKA